MRLALRLARRELRGGVRGLRIVLACLALGVAVIAAVGSLRTGVALGLAEDGRRILGGDLDVQGGAQQLPDSLAPWIAARGGRSSAVIQMRSMLVAPNGERQLIELKAVDADWPLVGTASFEPAMTVADALKPINDRYGIAVEPIVRDRLALKLGDAVRVGSATFTLRAVLTNEPDRVSGPSILGARALIGADALPATELIQPGAMLSHGLRAVLPPGDDPAKLADAIRSAYPGEGWRIRDAGSATPGTERFIEQTSLFLTLVGLTALLVGGVGVANGVGAWLDARSSTIATLRCLGATSGLVFRVYLIQALALSAAGVALGVAVGALIPFAAAGILGGALPVPPRPGPFAAPLLLAATYGLLTALAFALWPLGRAARISGAALLRDSAAPSASGQPRGVAVTALGAGALLIGLTVATAPDRMLAVYFCAAALATLAIFRAGAWALRAVARRLPRPRAAWARLGLASLHRPDGGAAALMLVSVGIGLSTLAAVALIEGNLRAELLSEMPAEAPSFYFIDIQNEQLPQLETLLARTPGVEEVKHVPNLRARVVAVNGVPAEHVKATPDTQWALRGDRGLTYAAKVPEGSRIVEGSWWPADYSGPPLLSFDAELAKGWGVHIGDSFTVNVLGREVTLKVANLREAAWRSLGINFTLVVSPGFFESAPHTHIATVRARPEAEGAILRAVTDAFPNVTGIRVSDILELVAALLGRIGTALAATGSVTLAAGALVLAGAVAAGQRRRMREAVILKTLGGTRGQIRGAWLVEFGALGLAAGVIAAIVGSAASFGVMHFLMDASFDLLPATLATTIAACIALMLVFGWLGTASALRAKAAPYLRNE